MAISQYKQNGQIFYRVYVHSKGKIDKTLRVQKSSFAISTKKEALVIEKKLIQEVTRKIQEKDGHYLEWGSLVEKWELAARAGQTSIDYHESGILKDHISRLHRFTKAWWKRDVCSLSRGDARALLNQLEGEGITIGLRQKIKGSINSVFKWTIEERLLVGVLQSPFEGISLTNKVEKLPKILTFDEIRLLLTKANKSGCPWYPIWAFAFFTGMRSGELKALQWKDIDLEKSLIYIQRSYCDRLKRVKSTKAGYWRTAPISSDLHKVISELKEQQPPVSNEDYVLPRMTQWFHGDASLALRNFLVTIGINKNIVFHTLRSCFATHMMGNGVSEATVMKIGGWRDLKTFQIYIRLAGIEVSGATEALRLDNFKSF